MISRKTLFFSSAQATSKNLALGTASFQFAQPIEPFLPSCKIALTSFSYTNFFINITAPNNIIHYSDNPVLPLKYAITIPAGSWGLTDLNDFLVSTQLAQVGNTIFQLEANYSTGKCSITFGNVIAWFVNLTVNAPPILGWGGVAIHIPVTDSNTAYYSQAAPNQAAFNTISQLKVTTNMAQDSIDNSALSSNVIHVSTPITSIGSVQTDNPTNLLTIESIRLGTGKVSEITFNIIDQNNAAVNLSEDFTITLIVV